ncbi:hypothetical protein N5D52_18540 [Pseudomonas sp. GD03860]|uniref:DUF6957 family protein n=1 Tax=Pseudomonas TaxID=286 RepID=UPI0023647502|nr:MULTISPECIES: hypothetical protein [Pseudomonas]MDD2059120.1 hypothetical protein [Pseudomonas putida]MDH0638942.1 hypothetical protein [Pseudomonas sp. GD03860]
MATTLEEVTQFLYARGEATPGWHGTQGELISLANQAFPEKSFCLVKQWIIADLQLTQDEQQKQSSLEILPTVVYAHEVVRDSRNRFPPGHWVRTNFGISHDHPCMFETKSTVYLLLGDGLRKQAALSTVFSFRA